MRTLYSSREACGLVIPLESTTGLHSVFFCVECPTGEGNGFGRLLCPRRSGGHSMLARASCIALYVVPVVRSTPLGLYVDWIAAMRRSFVCYWSSIVTSLSIYLFLTNSDRRLNVCSSGQHQLIRPLPHSRLVSRSQKPLIRSSRYSSREILTISTFVRRRCRRCCCCYFVCNMLGARPGVRGVLDIHAGGGGVI